jgi:DNA polymerase (family 10)
MTNNEVARKLQQHARELEAEGGSLFRARACRQAAFTIMGMARPLAEVLDESGREGLEALPGVGLGLGYTLEVLLRTGELRSLHSAGATGLRDLAALPGVGARALERMRDELGIASLEDMLAASEDGRLARLELPPKREVAMLEAVRERLLKRAEAAPVAEEPTVAELLAVDEQYRQRSADRELPLVAPRSFNPEGEKWLSVMTRKEGAWSYRVLHSNTSLAHRLGKTRDWVVVYFHDEKRSGQRTVVTETNGDLTGLRVVRGREDECRRHYQAQHAA